MKCTHFLRGVFRLYLLALFFTGAALSQTGTTSLHGVVTDKTGAAIVGATVRLSNPGQGVEREASTGVSGEYEFLVLQPGTYSSTAQKPNFKKYEQKGLQLLVNLPATANVTLEVGTASEIVEVSAQSVTLNTVDASIGMQLALALNLEKVSLTLAVNGPKSLLNEIGSTSSRSVVRGPFRFANRCPRSPEGGGVCLVLYPAGFSSHYF